MTHEILYSDFEIQVRRGSETLYIVSIVQSPAGQAENTFSLPLTPSECEELFRAIEICTLRSVVTTRQVDRSPQAQIQRFGSRLFEALFAGPIRECYQTSQRLAEEQGHRLRIKLHIDPQSLPELASLPWELMYESQGRRYPALSINTTLVRYIKLDRPGTPLEIVPPVSVLGIVASPRDYRPLDVEAEQEQICQSLRDLTERGLVHLDFLTPPTLDELQARLRTHPPHILHFVGHGRYDGELGSLLVFEDEQGDAVRVPGEKLGRNLADYKASLRLVVLNACDSGHISPAQPFASAALALLHAGIPAVVAMQFEISDKAAVVFAREFYAALISNYPVDAAVAEGRKAIDNAFPHTVEWGTPVIFMHCANGLLFHIPVERPASTAPSTTQMPHSAPPPSSTPPIPFHVYGSIAETDAPYYIVRDLDDDVMSLINAHQPCVTILGPRQTGKTSLLNRLAAVIRGKTVIILNIAIFERVKDESEWYRYLGQEILDRLRKRGSGRMSIIPPRDPISFGAFLLSISKECHGGIVVVFDEIGTVPPHWAVGFFAALRQIIDERGYTGTFQCSSFVLAGATDPRAYRLKTANSPFNVSKFCYTSDLSREQTYQLLGNLRMVGKEIHQAASDRVYDYTGGHPHLVQLVGDRLSRLSSPCVTEAAVDVVVDAICRSGEENLHHLREQIKQADPGARRFLQDILAGKPRLFALSDDPIPYLYLAGAIKEGSGGCCIIRNRIYEKVLRSLSILEPPPPPPPLPTSGRLDDLEESIRDIYKRIHDLENERDVATDPRQRDKLNHDISTQWDQMKTDYLHEYLQTCQKVGHRVPNDIYSTVLHFHSDAELKDLISWLQSSR